MDTWLIVLVVVNALLPLCVQVFTRFLNKKQMEQQYVQRQEYLASLKINDQVLTLSGIHGKIISIKNTVVELQISKEVIIYIELDSIMGKTKELLFK